MPKLQIKSISGRVLYEGEALSIKELLANAVNDSADLRGAYLRGADLTGADLTGAYLTGADLTGADLTGADLRGADLTGADLTGADLTGAYLRGADLRGAYLRGADLTGVDLTGADLTGAYLTGADLRGDVKIDKVPIQVTTPVYRVTIWDNHMQIGCEFHSIEDWWSYDNRRIADMDGKRALSFWKTWKKPLEKICKAEGRGVEN